MLDVGCEKKIDWIPKHQAMRNAIHPEEVLKRKSE